MNIEKFFTEISKPIEGNQASLLLERLYELSRAINNMEPDDLISLFQALSMLKKQQPWKLFGNPVIRNINDTQKIIIHAMKKRPSHATAFNNAIEDESINGCHYRMY